MQISKTILCASMLMFMIALSASASPMMVAEQHAANAKVRQQVNTAEHNWNNKVMYEGNPSENRAKQYAAEAKKSGYQNHAGLKPVVSK